MKGNHSFVAAFLVSQKYSGLRTDTPFSRRQKHTSLSVRVSGFSFFVLSLSFALSLSLLMPFFSLVSPPLAASNGPPWTETLAFLGRGCRELLEVLVVLVVLVLVCACVLSGSGALRFV